MMVHADVFFHITAGENATAERNPERFPLERPDTNGTVVTLFVCIPNECAA